MEGTNRLRGVLGMAAAWAVGLSTVATSLFLGGLAIGAIPSDIFGLSHVIDVASRALLVGGAAGALFALGIARTGRHTSFSALTNRIVALWGFLGGAVVAAGLFAVLGGGAVVPVTIRVVGVLAYGLLGASFGIVVLRVARRTPSPALEARLDGEPRHLPP